MAAWRDQNPAGAAEQFVAALGGQFHRDYGPVLRAVLFAADRHRARKSPESPPGTPFQDLGDDEAAALRLALEEPDQVPRLRKFRAAYPDVIVGAGEFGTWQARIPEPNGRPSPPVALCANSSTASDELTGQRDGQPVASPAEWKRGGIPPCLDPAAAREAVPG